MSKTFKCTEHHCDFCVVGGGLAGTIAALSAARKGSKVVLIQDRPVLGGNCSSEIRMVIRGARGIYNRETGILEEFEEENIYRNPTLSATVWDSVLFGKVKENKNITLLLNSSVLDAECQKDRITSVTAWQLTTYSYHKVYAKYFADCSGDSVLAPLSGAEHRIGREECSRYNESLAPEAADSKTMGMSCLLQARETDHKVEFIPPKWANVYETDADFGITPENEGEYIQLRDHTIATNGCNLWWMELGGDGAAIENTEETRDELLKVVFGVWDHIKNRGNHNAENWELEWVGFLPGKRESVRYVGDHILTQGEIEKGGVFEDVVAYGGWPMDDHDPKGINGLSANEFASRMVPAPTPYGIPYRALYSKNISNLFFAGRNISATHVAMSSTRVMGTCSLLGQAVGNAASICNKYGILPKEVNNGHVKELQQDVLEDGVFLPYVTREIPDLSKYAKLNLSDEDKNILFNGIERPRNKDRENAVLLNKGDSIVFTFDEEKSVNELRIQFDLDYGHASVSPHKKIARFAKKTHTGLDLGTVKVANTIVKNYTVFADGKKVFEDTENYLSFVRVPLGVSAKEIQIMFNDTWGADKVNIFACDLK